MVERADLRSSATHTTGLAPTGPAGTVHPMFSVRKGDRVGIKELGGKVSGPYVVSGFSGFDVEVTCTRTGRRMVVLQSDLCQYSSSR